LSPYDCTGRNLVLECLVVMLGEVGRVTGDVARIMRSNRNKDNLEAGKVTRW